jgi:hypothetical protein
LNSEITFKGKIKNPIEIDNQTTLSKLFGILKIPFVIIYGIFFFIFLLLISAFQKLFGINVKEVPSNEINLREIAKNNWSELSKNNELIIYQKLIDEIRFGPEYIKIRTEPKIENLENSIFGNWVYKTESGFFLQKWNTIKTAETNLIFINSKNLNIEIIKENIPSVLWEMKRLKNGIFELNCNTGNEELKYEIKLKKAVANTV